MRKGLQITIHNKVAKDGMYFLYKQRVCKQIAL